MLLTIDVGHTHPPAPGTSPDRPAPQDGVPPCC